MTTKHTPRLYACGQFVTDKQSCGFDADGARIGETPTIVIDAGTPELARLISTVSDLLEALQAIKARVAGEFDDPSLMSFGPLTANAVEDVERIAVIALAKARGEG